MSNRLMNSLTCVHRSPRYSGRALPCWLCVCLILLLSSSLCAADRTIQQLSQQVRDRQASCVRIISGSDRSSGVVISSDGHVLTVAHGITSQRPVTVVLASGTTLPAAVVARRVAEDVALLKCDLTDLRDHEPQIRPAPIDLSATMDVSHRGRLVFALGFPARHQNARPPVGRIGEIEAVSPAQLRSSCVLTAGDSGGPLFDADGQLIAIHQQIGLGRRSNLHLKLTAAMDSLSEFLPAIAMETADDQDSPGSTLRYEDLEDLLPAVPTNLTVKLRDAKSDEVIAYGTRLGPDLIVTKASLVRPERSLILRTQAVRYRLTTLGRNLNEDLLFLKEAKPHGKMSLPSTDQLKDSRWGDIVLAGPNAKPGLIGCFKCDVADDRSSLGCRLEQLDDGIVVARVTADTAAADAGLQPGDLVRTLNGQSVRDFDDVTAVLRNRQPGDWLTFGFQRNRDQHRSFGQLRRSGQALLSRTEYLDGRAGLLSLRRSGLRNVLQHDAPLEAAHMGGPLLNDSGQLIAVNIARRSREAVIAIPIERVLHHLKRFETVVSSSASK